MEQGWAEKLNEMIETDQQKSEQSVVVFIQESEQRIKTINTKLQILLEGYLDQNIDKEIYREHKSKLISEKKTLEEKITTLTTKKNAWLEPASWRKISARKRAKNPEFVWKNGGEIVARASRGRIGRAKIGKFDIGARGRSRTGTTLRSTDFKSVMSTNSITRAYF